MKPSENEGKRLVKCSECGHLFDPAEQETFAARTLNAGTSHERIVCDTCFDFLWDRNAIIMCENCGEWYDNAEIHSFELGDDAFAPCPNCQHDIVDGCTQDERLAEQNQ